MSSRSDTLREMRRRIDVSPTALRAVAADPRSDLDQRRRLKMFADADRLERYIEALEAGAQVLESN